MRREAAAEQSRSTPTTASQRKQYQRHIGPFDAIDGQRHQEGTDMPSHDPLIEKLSFTPAELAKATGLGRGAAYRVARQIGRRFGRRLLVSREAALAWLEDRSAPRAKPSAARCRR